MNQYPRLHPEVPLASHQLSNPPNTNTTAPLPQTQTLQTHPYTKPSHVANAIATDIATAIGIDIASHVATDIATNIVSAVAIDVANAIDIALLLPLLLTLLLMLKLP